MIRKHECAKKDSNQHRDELEIKGFFFRLHLLNLF